LILTGKRKCDGLPVLPLQLLQPFFGLALSAVLLHEAVNWRMVAVTIAVIGCVVGALKFAR
jgi:drug/metabolite transporter (DMT)-like permease